MKSFIEFCNESKDYHVHWKDGHREGEIVIKANNPKDAETKAMAQLNNPIPHSSLKIFKVGLEASLYKAKAAPTPAEWQAEMKRKESADDRYYSSGRYAEDLKYLESLRKK